jgi:hypothetical protein
MPKEKPDTKFRACRLGCGERYWCERQGTCPTCKAILASIAADNKVVRATSRATGRLPAAVSRGMAMSRNMGRIR